MADAYLPVIVPHLPLDYVMQDGELRPVVRRYVELGVVRVIIGVTACHVIIDIKRPYFHPYPER